MSKNGNQIKKNVALSMSAQVISLVVSCVLNLIVPKAISEEQYAQWQTYVLYVSYVGILHFGLLDGIMLRYSQYDYDQLDKAVLRSQFIVLTGILSGSSLLIVLFSTAFHSFSVKAIIVFVAIGTITKNVFTYTSYLFQITNRINKYVTLLLIQRVFYGCAVLILILLNARQFWVFCIADLVADIVAIIAGSFSNKGLYFGSIPEKQVVTSELKENISSGAMLLIANWSSMFLIGSARMIVQWHWDLLTFGKVSFSFSISNLFLAFVTAASVVLFPSLKRMDIDQLPKIYTKIRSGISPTLFLCMLGYYPGCWILHLWLPKYDNSLVYLGILLPIIVFTSKVSLLTNNYLKAYRKERTLLVINVVSVIAGLIVFLTCSVILDSLSWLLFGVVIVVMARSIVSEIVVSRIIRVYLIPDFIMETILTFAFMFITWKCELLIGFFGYAICVAIYICLCWYRKRHG